MHHLGGSDDAGGAPVRPHQVVAHLDGTHGRPPGGRRQRGVQGQRLSDAGAGGDDHHLSRVQPVGHRVQVLEARRHPERGAAARGDGVDLVHRRLQQFLERDVVLAHPPLGDLVDRRLRAVDHLVDVRALGAGVAQLHDPGAGLDQPAQDRLLRDDLRVVPGVGRGGHGGDQRVQVGRAADPAQLPPPLQLGRHGDRVGGLAAAVQVEHAVVDRLVRGPVEVAGAQHLDDVGDGVLRQHHAAEHALLRGEILGRLPVERTFRGGCGRTVIGQRHREPLLDNRTGVRYYTVGNRGAGAKNPRIIGVSPFPRIVPSPTQSEEPRERLEVVIGSCQTVLGTPLWTAWGCRRATNHKAVRTWGQPVDSYPNPRRKRR